MSHPRVEEVEDSDLEVSDPSEDDIDDFADEDIIRRVEPAARRPAAGATPSPPPAAATATASPGQQQTSEFRTTADTSAYAGYQCLYPVYFDSTRTRAEGRRVGRELAVPNPLAREIVSACAALRLQTLFEPTRMHPKDWANPGRVKVQLPQSEGGAPRAGGVKNKHHLYVLVARHLKQNPTTEHCASLRVRVPGAPLPDPAKPYPRPSVPRGWKMGELVPYYSPAMTGGGVSENLFKDMMKEMQAGGMPGGADMASLLAGAAGGNGAGPGMGGPAAGEGNRKKDKKGKGKA